jgi:hypothetical protein
MERGHELHPPKREFVRAADVHSMTDRAFIGAELRELKCRDNRGLMLFGECDRVAQVIPVAVGQQNPVEAGQSVWSDVGCGIASKEGVDDKAFAVSL